MRILIITQYFYPEEFKSNDLVQELTSGGHSVTVLTGKPNYPGGEYFKGYSFRGVVKEDYHGAEVIRVPLLKRGRGGAIRLVLNYYSYVFFAEEYIKKNKMEYDSILIYEPSPITQAYPALYCKKRYGGKVMLWVQDLWPESVTAAGGITNKYVLKILDKMVRKIYDCCDLLLIQSEAFRDSILSKGDYSSKLVYVPNWAEDLYMQKEMLNEHKIREMMPQGFRVMFAGNIGASQDIDSVILAANETKNIKEIKWVMVGDGRMRSSAEEKVKDLGLEETVCFLGRHPMNEMPTFFSQADIMVISLRDEYIFSLTIPNKTQSYMASGKPIVTILNGEGSRIVEDAGCGLTAAAGDFKGLANNVISFYKMNKEDREAMGKKGCEYYLKHFDKATVVDSIINSMKTREF